MKVYKLIITIFDKNMRGLCAIRLDANPSSLACLLHQGPGSKGKNQSREGQGTYLVL